MSITNNVRIILATALCLIGTLSLAGPRDTAPGELPGTPWNGNSSQATMLMNFFSTSDGFPRVVFSGTVEYVPATDGFVMFSVPSSVQLTSGGPLIPLTNSPSFRVSAIVDNTGTLVGGVSGADLFLKGAIDLDNNGTVDGGPILLTGEVTSFAWMDGGPMMSDAFELSYQITGGDLAPLFGTDDVTVKITATNSTFVGDFNLPWKASAAGTLVGMPCRGLLGDYVWHDLNGNGIQDANEPGIDDVTLILMDDMGNTLATTTTVTGGPNNTAGFYEFTGLCAGTYKVSVDPNTVPPGFTPTIINAPGSTPQDDSNDPDGTFVTLPANNSVDLDTDFGYVTPIGIDIEKATNGVDADDPNAGDAPQIVPGSVVSWTYVVTNTGGQTLNNVSVVDDQGVAVSCPQTTLLPMESMICTASGVAEDLGATTFTTVPGLCGGVPQVPLYENMGTATGTSIGGEFVEDTDPSHYCNPQEPSIDIEKATNGVDADDPNAGDAPQIAAGSVVSWTYVVTNTGDVTLFNVTVTDDQGVPVACPQDTLAPMESMICTASGLAEDLENTGFTTVPGLCGQVPNTPMYENMGAVTGVDSQGTVVDDVDPSHYCNPPVPAIDIEKATNGVDADNPAAGDAPLIAAGNVVSWTYVVTNTGNVTINDIVVTDDQGVSVSCPQTSLAPMASMICTASGLADDLNSTGFTTVPGTCAGIPNTPMYENMGSVTGIATTGQPVDDVDPSHYCNPPMPMLDIEKATNGVDADDPNAGDAPQIAAGQLVSWTYVVTNTGNVQVDNIVVTDDQGVPVACPQSSLAAGDSMICTASGLADDLGSTGFTTVPGLCGQFPNTPLYENMGTVTGIAVTGQFLTDDDPSHYCNPPVPSIDIEKATNGADADDPNAGDAPQIAAGDLVSWTYVVTNTGNVTINDIVVTDDQGVPVACPQTTLAPMAVMSCSASGIAEDLLSTLFTTVPGLCGQFPNTPLYENMGAVTGVATTGQFVEDVDPSHYCNPQVPSIDIEKATNGVDADDPNAGDAPQIATGGLVSWSYVVTNTGNVTIDDIIVTDDQGVPVACPQTTLGPGDTMTCTASGLADDLLNTPFTTVPGLCGGFPGNPMYENMGQVTGTATTGEFVEDTDASHYCNPPSPSIDIEKATNGVDADDPNAGDAPTINAGDLVSWTYVVTNTGNQTLDNVTVTDDQGVPVSCPLTTLTPGQTMICTASGFADDLDITPFTTVPGLCAGIPNTPMYENMGRATGEVTTGALVEDTDPSHYCNPPMPSIDIEKATNGVDADDPNAGDAPQILIDGVVTWSYVVTNTGNVTLFNVTVNDDQIGAITCPLDTLVPGQFMTCTATGIALDMADPVNESVAGLCGDFPNTPLYENLADVVGTSAAGQQVRDEDPSHYCNPQVPMIEVEKATNGVDADDPNAGDAPQIAAGDPVSWTYLVTNTGNVDLTNVSVADDQGVTVTCPMSDLAAGASMTCTATGIADVLATTTFTTVPGLCGGFPNTPMYENRGTATGQSADGAFVEDDDLSHYCNPPACEVSVDKTCLIPMAPPGDYVCTKPIDSLTFIYGGASPVRIIAWKGAVGSTQLADIDDIQPGEEITVMGYAGSPNDVFFEVFAAGTSTKIGESKFHLSCSDDEMDGPEDCGLNQGNGKGNDSGLINDWILEGIVDQGGTLDCTVPPVGGTDSCEFQAFPANCDTIGSVETLTLVYTGGGCAASDNDQGDKFDCAGGTDASQPVTVTLFNGDTFSVAPGESFTMPRDGSGTTLTLSNGGGTEDLNIHTSCSAPLAAGDVYGSLTLASINGVGIGTDVIYTYDITNNGVFPLTSLSAVDVPLGPLSGLPASLAPGATATVFTGAFLTETTTNTVVVDATDSQGAVCSATDQATVTILPPPPCEVDGEGVLEISSDRVKWNLTNAGAFNATIDSIDITWPAANGDLLEIKIDGDKIYDIDSPAPGISLGPSDWINDPAKRIIPPGDTDTLEIKFANDVVGPQTAYSITVNFEEGCSVTYVNTGLPFACNKPIDELSMFWDGANDPIRVKAWKGSVGSTLLLDQSGINVGDEVTVSGFAGSPNDVFWEIFSGSTKIGESKFHLSCSDNDMNGAEDCGKRQGNGKDNSSSLVNDWILEGMVDNDGPFDCSDLP